jgi:hypothetical protein
MPARRLPGHGFHPAALQPVRQMMKIGGEARKPALIPVLKYAGQANHQPRRSRSKIRAPGKVG